MPMNGKFDKRRALTMYRNGADMHTIAVALGADLFYIREYLKSPGAASHMNARVCTICKKPFFAGRSAKYCCEECAKIGAQMVAHQRQKKHPISQDTKRKVVKCTGCYYWRSLSNGGGTVHACHYAIYTGKLRTPLKAADCYKHEGTPYKPIGKEPCK